MPIKEDTPPGDYYARRANSLDLPVTKIKSVGATTASHLKRLNIETIGDLLYHFPKRYIDLSRVRKIAELRSGDTVTVFGEVRGVKRWRSKRGIRVVNISIFDGTGYVTGTWFNQGFIANRMREGMQVAFSGKIEYKYRQLQMSNPLYDVLSERQGEPINSARIVAIHPVTQNLTTNMMRRIMKNAIDDCGDIPDPLPQSLIDKKKLLPRSVAIREVHFPTSRELLISARARLIFEELFLMQVGLAARKKRIESQTKGIQHVKDGGLVDKLYALLPYRLTSDQKKVIAEIQRDMGSNRPMNRLLQGEVSSGKTVVALAALLTAIQGGYQAAMMAPTEVLAWQHYKKLKEIVERLGVKIALLTGTLSIKERSALLGEIKAGNVDLIIGTHAIIQESVDFKALGIAVIDEQHRFGVEQRIVLKEKGYHPDILIMSATPIPRTLSLTLYGDLDISIIKELPGERKVGEYIETALCNAQSRDSAYEKVRSEVRSGRQAYIVCPLIEESDKLQVKAVLEEAERLRNEVFPDLRVGLLHGRLKSSEKEAIMNRFSDGDFDILIATTVIEVGIDVPNATVILIEDADRFGLAQLHQLRGRIGRGGYKSYCILFAEPTTDEGKKRMDAICNLKDGFQLAEEDLQIRGEGQLFGTRQSGLPDVKLANLTRDIEILADAREEAFRIVEDDLHLGAYENLPLLHEVKRKFADNLDWLFQA